MNSLLISYDLNRPHQDYPKLLDELRSYRTRWHHLDSLWIIQTNKSAKEMRDSLKPLIDSDDEMLVVDITGDAAAWSGFTDNAKKWLKDNI